jgi:hypothetical protein
MGVTDMQTNVGSDIEGVLHQGVCNIHACAKATEVSFNKQPTIALIASHLVKHTANIISSLRSSGMVMMVMHLGPSHAHVRLSRWC